VQVPLGDKPAAPIITSSHRRFTACLWLVQFWNTEKGAPLEVMIRLANAIKAHPWFCIPHRAGDSYVASFAQVRMHAAPP